ncbi:MAG: hypothetical protein EXR07_05690 [Acetobacteraceae bacterium]|nr:hypothetical protein [Acetobacteraceae bacterium]
MVESFWAIPDVTNVRTPLSILREQASAITTQTKGALVGLVETRADGDSFVYIRLELSVPALNDYRYRILTYQQPVELYPGRLIVGGDLRGDSVTDESTFLSDVKKILSSEQITNVVRSLLAQAKEI